MDTLAFEDVKSIAEVSGGLCVSLYLPTQHNGAEAVQNPVRLRNLLRTAENELKQKGCTTAEIQTFLHPAEALTEDASFWEHPSEGLAVFVSSDLLRTYHLPLAFQEKAVVGQRFFIRPLVPLLQGNDKFYVLALSQNAVRLLEGTREQVREIGLEGVPLSLAEALQYDEPQAHQGTAHNAGRPFPGDNEPKEDRKEKLARFFHMIDKALPESIKNGHAPLALAGVDYEAAIYRQVSSCPHLMAEEITGNPEHLSLEALHERAWQIVQPFFQEGQQQALAEYAERIGTGLASNNITEIVPAAFSGRVTTLLVEDGPTLWGHFDPASNRAVTHSEARQEDEDLVNLATIETLLHGGAVYAVVPEELAVTAPTAAVFRY